EKYIRLVKELREVVNLANQRTMQDSELERKFFEQFIPQIIHPVTDLQLRLFKYQADAIHKFFKNQISIWNMGRQVGKTSHAALLLAFLSQELRGDAVIASFRMEQSMDIIDCTWERFGGQIHGGGSSSSMQMNGTMHYPTSPASRPYNRMDQSSKRSLSVYLKKSVICNFNKNAY